MLRCNDTESTKTVGGRLPRTFRTAMHDMKRTHFPVSLVLTTVTLIRVRSAEPKPVAGGKAATHAAATNVRPANIRMTSSR